MTGKHLCQSLFFNKVAGPALQLYLKRDCGTGVFLPILRNFQEHLSLENTSGGCFWLDAFLLTEGKLPEKRSCLRYNQSTEQLRLVTLSQLNLKKSSVIAWDFHEIHFFLFSQRIVEIVGEWQTFQVEIDLISRSRTSRILSSRVLHNVLKNEITQSKILFGYAGF